MDTFAQAISNIIKEQQQIIGPVAMDQAKKVSGLKMGANSSEVSIEGNKKDVLNNLIKQYSQLFGKTSIEICKEAFEPFSDKIPVGDIPDILKN